MHTEDNERAAIFGQFFRCRLWRCVQHAKFQIRELGEIVLSPSGRAGAEKGLRDAGQTPIMFKGSLTRAALHAHARAFVIRQLDCDCQLSLMSPKRNIPISSLIVSILTEITAFWKFS